MAEWFKAHAWKACVANHYRGFESLSLRHFEDAGYWSENGSAPRRADLKSATSFQGFLKSHQSFSSANRRFEPTFFRKSRFCSGFGPEAEFSACFKDFTNWMTGSNRLVPFALLERRFLGADPFLDSIGRSSSKYSFLAVGSAAPPPCRTCRGFPVCRWCCLRCRNGHCRVYTI